MPRKRVTPTSQESAPADKMLAGDTHCQSSDILRQSDALEKLPNSDALVALIPEHGVRAPSGPGRHQTLTRDVASRIVAAIRTGHYLRSAALMAGVLSETAHDWMRDGQAEDARPGDPRTLFALAVKAAESEAIDKAIRRVRAAGEKDWKAEMTWLGRRHREEWAEQRPEDNTGAKVQVLIGLALPGTQPAALALERSSPQVIEGQVVSVPRLPRVTESGG